MCLKTLRYLQYATSAGQAWRLVLSALGPPTVKLPPAYDTSRYEDIPDFAKVNPRPLLVITKATEGITWIDPTFSLYMDDLKQDGIHRGCYHFHRQAYASNSQAKHFCDTIRGHIDDRTLLVLDLEEGGESANMIIAFFDIVRQNYPNNPLMLYSRKNLLDPISMTTAQKAYIKQIPTWTAGYPDSPDNFTSVPPAYIPDQTKFGPVWLWQYSDAGIVEGINGGVDLNWISPELVAYLGDGGSMASAKVEVFEKPVKCIQETTMLSEPSTKGMPGTNVRQVTVNEVLTVSGGVTNNEGRLYYCVESQGFVVAERFADWVAPEPEPEAAYWLARVDKATVNVYDLPEKTSAVKGVLVQNDELYVQILQQADGLWGRVARCLPNPSLVGEWVFIRVDSTNKDITLLGSPLPELPPITPVLEVETMRVASGAMPLEGYDKDGNKVGDFLNENEITFRKVL